MNEYKRQVLDEVKGALEQLSAEKLTEVADFIGYLLTKEKQEKAEKSELDPQKDPIIRDYIGGVSVEPFAHKIDEILYGEED